MRYINKRNKVLTGQEHFVYQYKQFMDEWNQFKKNVTLEHFGNNEFEFYMYLSSVLCYNIYSESLVKLSEFIYKNVLEQVNLSNKVKLLFAKVGQEFIYTLPFEKESNIIISYDSEHIYVTFKGTSQTNEVLKDAKFRSKTIATSSCSKQVDEQVCKDTLNLINSACLWKNNACVDPNGNVEVHGGVQEYLDEIKTNTGGTNDGDNGNDPNTIEGLGTKDPLKLLYTISNQIKHRNKNIIITGHSLGAAASILFCQKLALMTPVLIERVRYIFLFGCPSIGNKYLQLVINQKFQGKCFNCVYGNDWVTWISNSIYYPVGTYVALGGSKNNVHITKAILSYETYAISRFALRLYLTPLQLLDHAPQNYIYAIYHKFFEIVPNTELHSGKKSRLSKRKQLRLTLKKSRLSKHKK
jgi:hypothetical protein